MNPIQTRFASVEALRHSEVDVQALKAHGELEVGGKCYQIRPAANDDLTLQCSEKQSKMGKFFKSAGLSRGSSSQSDQIAQVLNDKRASSGHRLARQGEPRFDPARLNIEEGQSSSAATSVQNNKQSDGRLVNSSILEWAQKAQAEGAKKASAIYKIYVKDAPHVEPLPSSEHRACLAHMCNLNSQNNGIVIWPQNLDDVPVHALKRMAKAFMENDPAAAHKYYRIERSRQRPDTENTNARLTVNVKPEFQKAMVDAAVKLTADNPDLITSKVAGPGKIGTTTDAAIFYVRGDLSSAQTVVKELKTLLPPEAFIDHTPAGMQSLGKGLCYAERAPRDDTSHGMSRATIISSALADTGWSPLKKKLRDAFKAAGYNPDNPAFRL